ncbi:MAG: hypothetical protein F4028_04630 [Acidimicrobiaceae bacterium]|nr:hypothetical protein [Acidimicrobiaceae bacterium]MYJ98268.1 hypothetical protein [Acidimicrobiaceae bacterium]
MGDAEASPASPARGSADEVILTHAEQFNQVVVTSNLDMILLCVERHQQVIWVDPRGRQLRREDLVLLVFKNISDWVERLENAEEPVCLRAMRTKTESIALDDADRRVRARMSRISSQRTAVKRSRPLGELFGEL